MARARFDLGKHDFKGEINILEKKFDERLDLFVDYHATQGAAYMKSNAPWTDRTTAARNGLHTIPEKSERLKEITFSHTVPYGIWLEIANSGKYQIIMPSVRHVGNEMMKRLKGFIPKLARSE